MPVLGSGHPLGDVFLLKHHPTQSEIHEGVAFFGRSGQALLKSLQRLGVDPLAVYGTNCLKFGTEEPAQARAWLTRELHIVQPRLVVAMGEPTVAFLAELEFPLSEPLDAGAAGRAAAVHAHDRRARHAGHRRVARRAGREDALLGGVQGARHVVGRASAVLGRRARAAALGALLAALCAWDAFAHALPEVPDASTSRSSPSCSIPATFAVVWLLLPVAEARGVLPVALATGALAVLLHLAGLDAASNVAKLVAFTLVGFWFLQLFEALSWVVLVAAVIPWVDIASVYRGPTRVVVEEEPGIFETIAIAFALPGEDAAARLGPPDVLFFALFLATAARFELASRRRGSG